MTSCSKKIAVPHSKFEIEKTLFFSQLVTSTGEILYSPTCFLVISGPSDVARTGVVFDESLNMVAKLDIIRDHEVNTISHSGYITRSSESLFMYHLPGRLVPGEIDLAEYQQGIGAIYFEKLPNQGDFEENILFNELNRLGLLKLFENHYFLSAGIVQGEIHYVPIFFHNEENIVVALPNRFSDKALAIVKLDNDTIRMEPYLSRID